MRPTWWFATRRWFDGLVFFVLIANLIPILWELVLEVNGELGSAEEDIFIIVNSVFLGFYLFEYAVKVRSSVWR